MLCHVIGHNYTLVTSAVAEWFDRARLQKFVNELSPPTFVLCKPFGTNVLWSVKGKVALTLDKTELWFDCLR